MEHIPEGVKHFRTYVRINLWPIQMVRKVQSWLSYKVKNLVTIDSYVDTVEEAEIRSMRLFSELGVSLLVQDHRTIECGVGDETSVLAALKL